MNNVTDIDKYIAGFPRDVQIILKQVRETIQVAAPEATEAIKYGMPTFVQNGNLIHFAAFKNHIGLYATPSGNVAFKDELAPYKQGKGSIQFPLNQPIPFALITKIVTYRVNENAERVASKTKKKRADNVTKMANLGW